jgi:outer membrane biosynthesis protein TonB
VPVAKEVPQFPIELVRQHNSGLIVVYAIADRDGKLASLEVKQTPDTQLNRPLLEALAQWRFRPAEMDGQAVAVKLLLGVPLWTRE